MLWHAIAPVRRYTKASHDVVRHPRLCSDAKILLLYVQGLPEDETHLPLSEHGRKLGIKGRAFQRAKEQLVTHGFVHEQRVPGEQGRWVTHQLCSNVPLSDADALAVWREAGVDSGAPPSTHSPTVGRPTPRTVGRQLPVDEEREKNTSHPPTETADTESDGQVSPPEAPEAAEAPEVAEAEEVLLSLRHSHRDLHLGVSEARALVAHAVEWLRRGISGGELRRVLTSDLPPGGVRSAGGFLRHRLVQKMPEGERRGPAAPVGAGRPAGVSPSAGNGCPEASPLAGAGCPEVSSSAGAGCPGGSSSAEAVRPDVSPSRPVVPRYVPPLVTCQGPGPEHVFRAMAGETECPECQQAAAWAHWAARRAADLGVDLAGDAAAAVDAGQGPGGWRARLAAAASGGHGGHGGPGVQ
ncbi:MULTISPECIES: hypothetical protein [unclassified Streptomyces]|uniref:hypothetical protein n=1 Tax=unclassified Streptomyces TaxID=2593676 RepID=UPI00093DCE42|nr:hypothetical protein [Streptomyces sp. TSRI0281]OKI32660.1 hypothetical protein A6A29_19415 [Streptomyces sp. TSRI0281]